MAKEKTKLEKFFSLDIDDEELKKQITNYNTLKINESYRGISALIILAISVMSIAMAYSLRDQLESVSSAIFGISVYLLVGYFVYKGSKKAMMIAMLLWTSDKLLFIFQSGNLGVGLFVVFFFWFVVIRFFWRALEVEKYKSELERMMKDQK